MDLESGAIKAHLTGHTATVYSLVVSNVRPSRLFSGSYDGTVRVRTNLLDRAGRLASRI